MDDILPQIESWLLSNYAGAAVITLCVVDYIETWPREFSSIWKRKLTGTSVLFLVNRYMLLLNLIIQAISAFPGNGTDEHCSQCVELAIPLLALGYDIFIFILTAIKTVQHSLEMQRLNQSSITQVIIRDGTLYFLGYYSCYLQCESLKVSLKSGNPNNFEGLPNILISRLMLNLRTYSEPGNTTISQGQQTHVSSLNFASNQMLGNIGAPLDGRSFNEEEEKEEERVEIEAIGGQHDRSGEPESLGVVVVKLT
ncbi:hypothetical protein GG344DRAFT_65247 [Lentinula edodes]|nr:hypothetical protein GG344DRAFT_65247 [Lentinula edodes]